ncbi:glycosyltransferase family 2 protein [Actinokineospora pegani]|uniref:glycosyltransferase family 2 protein n=1 Tax=Actinokineospora pegani TaxID=2654637 RepID=UPI001F1B2562|nr:glycosyltransferase family 2 protein [Actinokineospora pegani]
MRTTVVVVTWRGRGHLADCLTALAAQTRPHRTVVVDNASTDGSAAIAASFADVEVVRLQRNQGYAGALAAVEPTVTTEFTAWLNDDAVPATGWLAALEDAMAPAVGAASALLRRPDGTVQSTGVGLTSRGYGFDLTTAPVFGFCGGAALVRTSALSQAGGTPADFFCYYEDTDVSWRLRLAGWDIVSVPEAEVLHAHGATSRLGSRRFHRWNERNRLVMLLRCAPLRVAFAELARFLVTTVTALVRRPEGANFRPGLRLRVLAEVVLRLPRALAARRRGDRRADLWRTWAGTRPQGQAQAGR